MPKNTQTTQKQNNENYIKSLKNWKNSQSLNTNGVIGNDITQFFFLNDEPNATMTINWSVTPDANKQGIAAYHQSTNTSGIVATVTYSNLHNSYVLDSSGQKHLISKIVRQFSNLNKEISWGSKNTWNLMFKEAGVLFLTN